MEMKEFCAFMDKRAKNVKHKHRKLFGQAFKDGGIARIYELPNAPFMAEDLPKRQAKVYKAGYQAGYDYAEIEIKRDPEKAYQLVFFKRGSC